MGISDGKEPPKKPPPKRHFWGWWRIICRLRRDGDFPDAGAGSHILGLGRFPGGYVRFFLFIISFLSQGWGLANVGTAGGEKRRLRVGIKVGGGRGGKWEELKMRSRGVEGE